METLLFYFSTFLVFELGPEATGPRARGNPYGCKVPSGWLESGRSVRVNSHADVPEEERVVTFKMFQVVLPGIGPTMMNLRAFVGPAMRGRGAETRAPDTRAPDVMRPRSRTRVLGAQSVPKLTAHRHQVEAKQAQNRH